MKNIITTLLQGFSPLKNTNFRIYAGGQFISLLGTWLQVTAQGWLVWELTGSEAALGVVTMLNTLPLLLLGPWAGVWADRLDRRKLLIWTQVGAMLLAFMMAALVQFELVQLWHVFALAAGLGIVNALDLPAQQTFLGDLTGMGEVRKAIGLNAAMLQFSRVLGPVFAGFLIATIGNAPAFWLNGLSFLAVIASLMAVRANQTRRATSNARPLSQIMDAFRFLQTQPRLQDMFTFMALMTFFYWSIVLNLLPVVASKVLGGDATTLGTLQAASGAGAMVGLLLVVPLANTLHRTGLVLGASALWVGVWLFGFAASQVVWLSFLTLFTATLAAPVIFTMAIGTTQVIAPPDMRARLISLFTMISFGLQPVAALAVGVLAENFGVQPIILLNAV
ncbi:MAG: MFS transporter, partial [Anaerolineae bacterium]|nr:MFS transporter [Anaerolineae bacterium]